MALTSAIGHTGLAKLGRAGLLLPAAHGGQVRPPQVSNEEKQGHPAQSRRRSAPALLDALNGARGEAKELRKLGLTEAKPLSDGLDGKRVAG